jgi:L-serine dehydratase
MQYSLRVMQESEISGMERGVRSASGLTGGDAWKMSQRIGRNLMGDAFVTALTRAIAVSETNACMGRIVAAPTAGSCGILPACLLTVMEDCGGAEDDAVKALFTASAVGMVIARNATIAGAEGGCQAECGAASAMAAAAVTEMCGGTPEMVENACAIALKNVLGLVCDPVAGLVEIPCIKRNVMGTANAFAAAEMALAGIDSKIPADEVIWAMKKIGDSMHSDLRETARGGLAATPTGRKLTEQVFGKMED